MLDLRVVILVDPLNSEFFFAIIEDCKYELTGKCLEVSLLCILLEYFDISAWSEVIVAINEEVLCVSTEADDFTLLVIFALEQ